jgi:ribonuclease HI
MGAAFVAIDIRNPDNIICVNKFKVISNTTASTCPKLHAILQAIYAVTNRQTIINIFTDSEASIKVIQKANNSNNQRELMKLKYYPIIQAIVDRMDFFTTRPNFTHVRLDTDIHTHNDTVDKAAKDAALNATLISNIRLDKITDSSKEFTFLYSGTQHIDLYPSTYIKNNSQIIAKNQTQESLDKKYPTTIINHSATAKITQKFLATKTKLDGSHSKESGFRLKLINKLLYTLDKLKLIGYVQDDTCRRCGTTTETFDHIFECEKTKDIMPQLLHTLTIKAKEIAELGHSYKKLIKDNNLDPDIPWTHIIQIMGFHQPDFLNSPLARGIITQTLIDKTDSELKLYKQPQSIKALWRATISSAWLNLLQEHIWIPRTKITTDFKAITLKRLNAERERNRERKSKRREQERILQRNWAESNRDQINTLTRRKKILKLGRDQQINALESLQTSINETREKILSVNIERAHDKKTKKRKAQNQLQLEQTKKKQKKPDDNYTLRLDSKSKIALKDTKTDLKHQKRKLTHHYNSIAKKLKSTQKSIADTEGEVALLSRGGVT